MAKKKLKMVDKELSRYELVLSIVAIVMGVLVLTSILTLKEGFFPFSPTVFGWILVGVGLFGVLHSIYIINTVNKLMKSEQEKEEL